MSRPTVVMSIAGSRGESLGTGNGLAAVAPRLGGQVGVPVEAGKGARRDVAAALEALSAAPAGGIPPQVVTPEVLGELLPEVAPMLGLPPKKPAGSGSAPPAAAAPEAAAKVTVSPPIPSAAPAVEKPSVTRVTKGEGDDQLSIHIQNADLREVLEALSEKGNLNILAGNAVQGKVSATLRGVNVDTALRAVLKSTGYVARREDKFIYVGTPEEFTQIEQSLDVVNTRVYRPNYVAAAELQTLIQPLLTTKTGVVSVSAPGEKGIGADDAQAGGNSFAGGDVVLVRDYEAILAQVDQVVAEVDVRPMQVAIESMILSVKLTDTDKMGVNWQLLRNNPNIAFALGTPSASLPATFNGGLEFAFLDSSLGAFLDALEEINDVNVIATPRLVALNKQRAEIQIGRQEGYVTSTVTETSTTQTMQTMDTGTILRLRPYISRDGLVRLEVHPELSSGAVTEKAPGQLVPDKEITQVTSNVIVRDGCTVIIGGLMREELKKEGKQLPILGSLPVVGAVFRNRTETTSRHEILVLITPRIVYDPEACAEGDRAACEFHRRQAVYADKMCHASRLWTGRKYFRMAENAWTAGDRDRALRFAELSVHFDPTNRAAIDLRNTVWGGSAAPGSAAVPGVEAALDGPTIAPWVLQELQRPDGAAMHPLDPGVPGDKKTIKRAKVTE